MSVNKATLLGHVGQDPEVKTLDSGRKVATITLATTERGYTTQSGAVIPDRTEWHSLVLWAGLAEVAEKYVRKGSQLYVEGKITTRSWEKDGNRFYKTEIQVSDMQMLGAKKSEPQAQEVTAEQSIEKAQQSGYFPEVQKVTMPDPVQGETQNDLPF